MEGRLRERVEYGRAIRQRALCLIEAHGVSAPRLCAAAAAEAGLPAADRNFLTMVGARIARLQAPHPRAARSG
jgi:hypothetical protein